LSKRPLAERRGRGPFEGTKDDIAQAFGWRHTAFESGARTLQTMGVLKLQIWQGRGEASKAKVLFLEHPLERLLRKTLQDQGRDKTVSVGGRGKRVKNIEIGRLREVARRYGYLPEEVDEALELLALRQYVERQPDGTVQEFAGALDVDELRHQAQQIEERLSRLAVHFPDGLRSYESLLREAYEYLTNPEDEIALDMAQRKLRELQVRLEEFIKGRARELMNQLAGLEHDLERRSSDLEPRELEQQITGAVDFVRHVDDQRQALQRKFRYLSRERERLREIISRAQGQAQAAVDNADEGVLCATADKCRELNAAKQQLEAELNRLQPYLTGLQRWREVVSKATFLRERLEPEAPPRQRLEGDVTIAIMENFAVRQLEALLDWERFKAEMDAIEAEVNAEESRLRDEFFKRKEQYEQTLGRLMGQRMIQATFDPKDSEQSYQVLYQGALRKLQRWLSEQGEIAQRMLNDFDYLIHEQGVKADSERDFAEQVLREFQQLNGLLNQELVEDPERFQDYCSKLEGLSDQLRDVKARLGGIRIKAVEQPSEEERPLLDALTNQRCSLEDLRRQLRPDEVSLDELFERLKELYRKGHIEIEVRRRRQE